MNKKPGFLTSLFGMRCPRCRRGKMFINKNPYSKFGLKHMLDMPERCPVCNQKFELETGFWYGTGYVSYGITVAISVFTFLLWWVLVGFSVEDNRIFYWLILNGVLVVVLQPWLMRLSRVIYLWFFVKYSESYETENPKLFT